MKVNFNFAIDILFEYPLSYAGRKSERAYQTKNYLSCSTGKLEGSMTENTLPQ